MKMVIMGASAPKC